MTCFLGWKAILKCQGGNSLICETSGWVGNDPSYARQLICDCKMDMIVIFSKKNIFSAVILAIGVMEHFWTRGKYFEENVAQNWPAIAEKKTNSPALSFKRSFNSNTPKIKHCRLHVERSPCTLGYRWGYVTAGRCSVRAGKQVPDNLELGAGEVIGRERAADLCHHQLSCHLRTLTPAQRQTSTPAILLIKSSEPQFLNNGVLASGMSR